MNALIKRFLVLAMALPFGLLSMCSSFWEYWGETDKEYAVEAEESLSEEESEQALTNDIIEALKDPLQTETFWMEYQEEHCGENILVWNGEVYQHVWEKYADPNSSTGYSQCGKYRTSVGTEAYDLGNSMTDVNLEMEYRSLEDLRKEYIRLAEEIRALVESDVSREFHATKANADGADFTVFTQISFDREEMLAKGYSNMKPYLYVDTFWQDISVSDEGDPFKVKPGYSIGYNEDMAQEWLEINDFPKSLLP